MGKTSKVVVCGMKGVGKTAVLEQLIYGNVNLKSSFYPTIEDIYVANIETDRGTKERVCFYDTAGLEPPLTGEFKGPPQSPTMQLTANQVLQRHYLGFAEGFVMVYDTTQPESLDVLMYLKKDIDRNKDKKEVVMLVIGNRTGPDDINSLENTCSKAANWCAREKIRHFEVSAMDRPSLYEPFIFMTTKLNPVQNKTAFPQLSTLSKLTQKNNRSDAM
ncbi:NF-kappa-B inhibitor-interacting Ras-like protein isoform X1 [Vanessa cardui]|uniref:NF-kappa-B inhibitor-interacting Ras-like protein isoform X1 n=1 Tax=Vanessa cardui TaxID=171605 RepID=UPI001F12C0F5|nr:NF-kappa-B inhibitor-interacting Ras-like protein isoform X1 [Vanessa cardui]